MRAPAPVLALLLLAAACGKTTEDEFVPAPADEAGAPASDASDDASDVAVDASPDDATPKPDAATDAAADVDVDAPPSCPGCAGCCDPGGNCRAGHDPAACGTGGAACSDCTVAGLGCDAKGQCGGAPPPCGPGTCDGCCDAKGVCRFGTDLDACGTGGQACSDCGTKNQACDQGSCQGTAPACGASSCGGCCDASGTCRGGTANSACGLGGASCTDCGAKGLSCIGVARYCGSVALCNPASCPNGCCDAQGVCRDGRSDGVCGTGGQACADCAGGGKACSPVGYCYTGKHCGPDNCAGCCSPSGDCQGGTSAAACGLYGNVCSDCGSGAACHAGACDDGGTCPAGYAGCAPGSVTAPPTHATSCSDADLAAIATACSGRDPGPPCQKAFENLVKTNLGCFACLDQFVGNGAYARCLAPWITQDCNTALTCAVECSNAVCGQCSSSQTDACANKAYSPGGACETWLIAGTCAEPALQGPASFCRFDDSTDSGQWLLGVGKYYCR